VTTALDGVTAGSTPDTPDSAPGVEERTGVARPLCAPTVLVVDGDPAVCEMLARAFQLLGGSAVCAANGEAALAIAGRHAETLALLVAEVATPGLTGGGLARTVERLRRRTPVLFVSHDRPPRDLGDAVIGRRAAFLAKPVSFEALRRVVGELTD
jgi:CheY-like chemotaxis protein